MANGEYQLKLRIGSVPYLNVKPLVDWFHSEDCDIEVDITYAVPSKLAQMLKEDSLDVANVSIFESFQNSELLAIPDISISANGAVKSVRLFSRCSLEEVKTVALDTSSLTSAALTRILLSEQFHITPQYTHYQPDLDAMLEHFDAGLIIGDLKIFELAPDISVYDLGAGWKHLTGLPFVYACWLGRRDRLTSAHLNALNAAKKWGSTRLNEIAAHWAKEMSVPFDRALDYLVNVMDYSLPPEHIQAAMLYQSKCYQHQLIPEIHPIQFYAG